MRKFHSLAFALVLVSGSALLASAEGPSFNCEKATYPDERTICASKELSELDTSVVDSYNDVRKKFGDQYAKSFNGPLIEARRACASDAACIKQVQFAQIEIFQLFGRSPHVYVSPDATLRALVLPIDVDVHQHMWESHVIISTSKGKRLASKDYSSEGAHGHYVVNAKWSPDSQFFVYSMSSSGGHSPWHFPTWVYSHQKNLIINFEEIIGGKPTVSKDFNFSGPHTVTATIWKKGLEFRDEDAEPIVVDLEDAIKKIAPSSD